MSLIQNLRRRAGILTLFVALLAAVGCATDSPVPDCFNCGQWTELMTGLGRFPEPHPANPDILLFSTIDKSPTATDADRQSDEDIWLVYRNPSDPSTETLWQLTDDALGGGDNFAARWSPSGTQIAFVHVTAAGRFEVWRMPVTVPASPEGIPVLGTAELLLQSARDPAWESETSLVFTREDKIYRVDVPASPGPLTASPVQLTFDPPIFASTETYVDRQPMIAADGGAVFNTIGRQNVADVYLRAFEIDGAVFPPDTTETAAWISYKAPTSDNPAYPLFVGVDTLRTPELLPSLPVGAGGTFPIGVRRDSRYISDPRVESYCDTTLIINADLQPGDVDTLSYYFTVIRGTLSIQSGISQTEVFWTRQDAEQDINDFPGRTLLANIGERLDFECLMPFSFLPNGEADVTRRELFLVIGSRGSLRDTALVTVPSGGMQSVRLFPTGTISGTVVFSDSPSVRPPVLARALLSGTSELVASAAGDTASAFRVRDVPEASFDVEITAAGYQTVVVSGVSVMPPGDTALGAITMNPVPGAERLAVAAAAPA
ncbi:MAG: carboxypeptidase regulatory-like domain-containing protein, partial [Gemmatimonadetes bacterium]|nr:carboxypeptidase regulatory-like domain-containing protein [Gemmatimonadota bacterium]